MEQNLGGMCNYVYFTVQERSVSRTVFLWIKLLAEKCL